MHRPLVIILRREIVSFKYCLVWNQPILKILLLYYQSAH